MKIRILLISCLWIMGSQMAFSQGGTYPGNYSVTSQAGIDTFNFMAIAGNLVINGDNIDGDITNLNGFGTLVEIGTDLVIQDMPTLETIAGFENLICVPRSLIIQRNDNLTGISGFSSLTKVGSNADDHQFLINENRDLESITAFPMLNQVNGYFRIWNNESLVSMDFPNLQIVNGSFNIENNDDLLYLTDQFSTLTTVGFSFVVRGHERLQTINGFNNLTTVGYSFNIGRWSSEAQANIDLETIDGFNLLETVGHTFRIDLNPVLVNINSFLKLREVGHNFYIIWCEDLETITAFDKLETVGNDNDDHEFRIADNASLETVSEFPELTEVDGYFRLWDNASLTTIFFNTLETVTGSFHIEDNDALTNLTTQFSNLETIGFSYVIRDNEELEIINGFNNLRTVGYSLNIGRWSSEQASNPDLEVIDGFGDLRTIGHTFRIDLNPSLETINGFPKLSDVGHSFLILESESLTDINDFDDLEDVGSDIDDHQFLINNNRDLVNINAFPKLNHITGYFRLWNNGSLENISFDELELVDATFHIENNEALTNLTTQFPNLRIIGFSFVVRDNETLQIIDGFNALTEIGYSFNIGRWSQEIQGNPNLEVIGGFNSLETIGHTFRVDFNNKLEIIRDFSVLTDIAYTFLIYDHEKLQTIEGFNALEDVGSDVDEHRFWIQFNDELQEINAFQLLENITGSFWILDNPSLSLMSFNNLRQVNWDFSIRNNDLLCQINSIFSLESVGRNMAITDNANLSGCCILDCINVEEIVNGNINISDNVTGCNSLAQLAACDTSQCPDACTGTLDACGVCDGAGPLTYYLDADNDGMGDPNNSVNSCCALPGYVLNNTDDCDGMFDECGVCNGPGIPEGVCDCDGNLTLTWYQDMDDDGLGNANVTLESCQQPEGYVDNGDDPDDTCAGEVDECGVCNGDGIPDGECDCNGTTPPTWCQDADGDGLGNPDVSTESCDQPTGYVSNCNDDDDECMGELDECGVCNGDGIPDGTCDCQGTPQNTWYADTDMDGLGDPNNTLHNCDNTPPTGYVDNSDDDDDNVPVSIEDAEFERQITLTPNPTTSTVTIQHPTTSTPTQIHLIDLNGRNLSTTQSTTGEIQLDLSALPEGIYLVHLANENYTAFRKVLKSGR